MASATKVSAEAMAQLLALELQWWQIKKHRRAGKQVYTCLLQKPGDHSTYYKGTDESLAAAISQAIEHQKINLPSKKEDKE